MRTMAALLLITSSTAPLAAQSFSGSYAARNNQGGTTTVTLNQSPDGRVTGTMVGLGNTFTLEGMVEDDAAFGIVTTPQGALYFDAELVDGVLELTLIGPDQAGEPNWDDATTLVFQPSGAVASEASPSAGANPLAGGGNPLASTGAAGDPWAGAYGDGNLTIQLQGSGGRYQGQIQFQGQAFPVTLQGDARNLSGSFQTNDGAYPVQMARNGNGVALTTGGTTYALQPQGAGQPAGGGGNPLAGSQGGAMGPAGSAGAAAGGGGALDDGSALGREWSQWLAGKKVTYMDSYSSGSAGGYSMRQDYHLCASGEFAFRDQSSVNVDTGGAFGYSGGSDAQTGRWRIITQGQVAGVELRYNNGNVEQYRLDYQDGATYANGTRVYVTASELCGM